MAMRVFCSSVVHCWKSHFSKWKFQKVPLCITDMLVIDHKEKVSLINHKIICD